MIEAVGPVHIQNALGVSHSVAQSIIDTYYKIPSCRITRSPRDAIDNKLLERAIRIMGAQKTYSLVDSDMVQIKRMERDTAREAMLKNEVSRLRDELTGTKPKQGVTEMSNMDRLEQKMQEQHDILLAALQSLARTNLPTQGSMSAPQPSSAQYARTGQPNAVYNLPSSNGDDFTGPVYGGSAIPIRDGGGGGGGKFYGQGNRNQEVVIQTPPRRYIQAQDSTAYTGAKEGTDGARPVTSVSTDPGEAALAFPTNLVFWQ